MAVGTRMSYEEFMRLPEQPGLQLIDGFLVKEPSPTYDHQSCVMRLIGEIQPFVRAHRLGEVLVAPLDVVLSPTCVVQPDLLYIARERLGIIQTYVMAAPDLAVEVLAPSTRALDEGRKRELYFAHGCRELWLIDLEGGWVEVSHPAASSLASVPQWNVTRLFRGDRIVSRVLPGFELDVSFILDEE